MDSNARAQRSTASSARSTEEKPPPIPPEFTGSSGIPMGWNEVTPGHYQYLTYAEDQHLVTIGPTGSGKNTMAQTPALLDERNQASALVIDVKGQLCAITTRRRQQMGHTVVALNPFDMLGIPSVTYNPLAYLDPGALSFTSDCERIAEGLVSVSKGDHWELSALDYIGLLITWVKLYEDGSLVDVYNWLSVPDDARITLCNNMIAWGTMHNPTLAIRAARYTSDAREVRDCIQTARVQMAFLGDPAIQRVLEGGADAMSFAELKRQKMTVFLIIPPELLHTRAKFLRLLVMAALGELIRERTKPDEPVLFMLDEFAQLGAMSMIENAAAIVRDYKLRLWIILQNLPQLQALYGDRWESFLSSAGVVQVFTPNDMTTAGYFSRRAGTVLDLPRSFNPLQGHITYSEQRKPMYTEQDLFGMAKHRQLLFCYQQSHPFDTNRYPYHEPDKANGLNARYAGTYEDDPYRMTTEEVAAFEHEARSGQWYITPSS